MYLALVKIQMSKKTALLVFKLCMVALAILFLISYSLIWLYGISVGSVDLKELLFTLMVSVTVFAFGVIYQMIFHTDKFVPKKFREPEVKEEDKTKQLVEQVALLIEEIKKDREAKAEPKPRTRKTKKGAERPHYDR